MSGLFFLCLPGGVLSQIFYMVILLLRKRLLTVTDRTGCVITWLTSRDEFPQFLNVLIGNMSLVGWRPCTLNEWKEYGLEHRSRAGMKPGITGMWQVSGRSEITDFDEVVRLDQEYMVISFEDHCFITAGRKNAAADGGDQEERLRRIKFTYTVSRNPGKSGRHFEGPDVDGYGNELWIMKNGGEQKEKSISRSTVECGLRNALRIMKNQGYVKGPKALGIPGAGSYLYAIFLNWGIIKDSEEEA